MTSPRPIYEFGMHFDPSAGGADRYFHGLVQSLQQNDIPCTALAFGTPAREATNSVSLGRPDAPLLQRLQAIRQAAQFPEGATIATHFALYAAALPSLRKHTHVVHFHGPWATESAREGQSPLVVAAKRWIEKRVYHSARRLVVLSGAFQDVLVQDYQIPAERIRIIPGGVDTERFRPLPRKAARQKLGWPENARLILCVRRLVKRMGISTLIESFAAIRHEHPDALLVIAGRGPLEGELREVAQSAGVGDQVIFAGFIPDEDLPAAYSSADFSIVPSEALEGFGLTTLESLACGTPVLVTPVGGLPETVSSLDPSLILGSSDVPAITAGVQRGLTQPLPPTEACRAYAESHFAWRLIARRVAATYEEAAA